MRKHKTLIRNESSHYPHEKKQITLNDLPSEVLHQILSFSCTSPNAIGTFSSISKHFYQTTVQYSSSLWSNISHRSFENGLVFFKYFDKKSPVYSPSSTHGRMSPFSSKQQYIDTRSYIHAKSTSMRKFEKRHRQLQILRMKVEAWSYHLIIACIALVTILKSMTINGWISTQYLDKCFIPLHVACALLVQIFAWPLVMKAHGLLFNYRRTPIWNEEPTGHSKSATDDVFFLIVLLGLWFNLKLILDKIYCKANQNFAHDLTMAASCNIIPWLLLFSPTIILAFIITMCCCYSLGIINFQPHFSLQFPDVSGRKFEELLLFAAAPTSVICLTWGSFWIEGWLSHNFIYIIFFPIVEKLLTAIVVTWRNWGGEDQTYSTIVCVLALSFVWLEIGICLGFKNMLLVFPFDCMILAMLWLVERDMWSH